MVKLEVAAVGTKRFISILRKKLGLKIIPKRPWDAGNERLAERALRPSVLR